jgi:hypothetical protein
LFDDVVLVCPILYFCAVLMLAIQGRLYVCPALQAMLQVPAEAPFHLCGLIWINKGQASPAVLLLRLLSVTRVHPAMLIASVLQVAADECSHFCSLAERLEVIGSSYGALPAHDG